MNVVITGTSRGIGHAVALRFLQAGHMVYGLDTESASITDERYIHYQCFLITNKIAKKCIKICCYLAKNFNISLAITCPPKGLK